MLVKIVVACFVVEEMHVVAICDNLKVFCVGRSREGVTAEGRDGHGRRLTAHSHP